MQADFRWQTKFAVSIFETEFPDAQFPEHAYYVIVTRGHEHDYTCLRNVLTRSYGYIGMIGSRSKVKLSRERLAQEGFSAAQIDEVHAPVGLRIGDRRRRRSRSVLQLKLFR